MVIQLGNVGFTTQMVKFHFMNMLAYHQAAAAKSVLEHFPLFLNFSKIDETVKQTNLYYHKVSQKKSVSSGFKT